MTRCSSIKPNITKICAGDFNRKITIQHAASISNNNPNQNAGSSFANVKTYWCLVKTNPNANFQNGTNVNQGINIDFYIRYDPELDISQQLWVEYNSDKYKISEVENIDLMNEIIRLRGIQRGNKNFAGNLR